MVLPRLRARLRCSDFVSSLFCLIAVLRKLAGPAELTLQFPLPLFQREVNFLFKVGLRTCRADTAVLAHYFLGCVSCFASEACSGTFALLASHAMVLIRKKGDSPVKLAIELALGFGFVCNCLKPFPPNMFLATTSLSPSYALCIFFFALRNGDLGLFSALVVSHLHHRVLYW